MNQQDFSPYELVFGRPARIPIKVEQGVLLQNPSSQSDYAQSLRKAIQLSNQLAQRKLADSRDRQSSQYNKSHQNWTPFEIGQAVWLLHPKK